MMRFLSALAMVLSVVPVASSVAWAGNVGGTVQLPNGHRAGRLHQGYWRLENGNVPVQPTAGPRIPTLVLVDGVKPKAPMTAKTVTVEIAGLDAQPRLLVVGPGSVLELKNTGKVTHEFGTPADSSFMPFERLAPGAIRRHKFNAPGGYLVRCAEYPHLTISVVVVESTFYAMPDERGSFSIPGVTDGKGTLKVWSAGQWMHEQEIDTTAAANLAIKVAPPAESKEATE